MNLIFACYFQHHYLFVSIFENLRKTTGSDFVLLVDQICQFKIHAHVFGHFVNQQCELIDIYPTHSETYHTAAL